MYLLKNITWKKFKKSNVDQTEGSYKGVLIFVINKIHVSKYILTNHLNDNTFKFKRYHDAKTFAENLLDDWLKINKKDIKPKLKCNLNISLDQHLKEKTNFKNASYLAYYCYCLNIKDDPATKQVITDSFLAYCYCKNINNDPEIRKLITDSFWAYSYCKEINDDPEVRKHIIKPKWAYYYCRDINNDINVRKYINDSFYAYLYCKHVKDDPAIRKYITETQWINCYNKDNNIEPKSKCHLNDFLNQYQYIKENFIFKNISYWAYCYCKDVKDVPEIRKHITESEWAYRYCSEIKDDPEIRKHITETQWINCYNKINQKNHYKKIEDFLESIIKKPIEIKVTTKKKKNINTIKNNFNSSEAFQYCKNVKDIPKIRKLITEPKWAYYYCSEVRDIPEIRKLITDPRWAYMYCKWIKDIPEVRKYITTPKWVYQYCKNIKDYPEIRNPHQ